MTTENYEQKHGPGHAAAVFTILLWGTTFISTKLLLKDFTPVEILIIRFVLGLIGLIIACPKPARGTTLRQELTFAGAGLSGITLYYLLENIALTHTTASNASVIVSVAPFFTVLLSYVVSRGKEKLRLMYFVGFAIAMAGICMLSFTTTKFQAEPVGDLLALLAAVAWAFYSILTRKTGSYGFSTMQVTRRIFAYGVLFMIPAWFITDCHLGLSRFADPVNLGNMLFLGLGASALCFATWNFAIKHLGAVKSSVYIYAIPPITVIAAAVVLGEQVTPLSLLGIVLTLAGLIISEMKFDKKNQLETSD
jgi:drug/metabolite transporter (DMT)-like permease